MNGTVASSGKVSDVRDGFATKANVPLPLSLGLSFGLSYRHSVISVASAEHPNLLLTTAIHTIGIHLHCLNNNNIMTDGERQKGK